ncbi:MAG: hypothetical protein OEW98_00075 [Betaproteobacteria bacterium]|nr:hypothetical protein [Betaproteobacteria bacterium]
MVSVPRLWPGETVVCVATGPSLTAADVDYCRGKARVIVVNDAYRLAPWADALYACDVKWWRWHEGVPSFTGPKWSLDHSAWVGQAQKYPDVQRLRNTGPSGLEHDPTGLKNGRNSGYQAVNLAVHYGAARIILLGYDMQPSGGQAHFFGEHPNKQQSPYDQFRRQFLTLVKPLQKKHIAVINCTRRTVLTAFPCADLRATLVAVPECVAC